ncbi:MAG TPA: hypothetical protein VM848_06970 [Acidimicrobiia bacterium]|nr:hypothetical protein [Acidimicrobiia bacterium]
MGDIRVGHTTRVAGHPVARLGRQLVMMVSKMDLPPALKVGRRVGISGVAALLGGVLVLGVGGRLAMRLSGAMAIVNNPGTRGRLTGDGFLIGRISVDGSLGLILFGGVFGSIIAAGYWALLKDRIADRGRLGWAALAAAAIGGNAFVKPDNIDFVILEPVALNVLLYTLLSGLAGVVIVAIDGALTRRQFGSSPLGAGLLLAFGLGGASLVGTLAVVSIGDEPAIALELIVLALVAIPLWIGQASRWKPPVWVVRVAPAIAIAVVTVEWIRLLRSAWVILSPS